MKKVLIVEDSAAMRSMIAAAMDRLSDIATIEVSGGLEALRRLPTEPVDLVITDINMPDINGLELIAFLRKHERYQKIPIIIVSSEAKATDRERGMALGANAYVVKPFAPEQLAEQVTRLLAG